MLDESFSEKLEGYLDEAGVSTNSAGTALSIINSFFSGSVEDVNNKNFSPGNINLIPSEQLGSCHDLLLALCSDKADFHINTLETINLCLHCRGVIKAVIVATNYWNEKEFIESCEESFYFLHYNFNVQFFLVTSHADGLMFELLIPKRAKKKK